ncbi:MAG: septal ring lytic transglycosylase RlpA family protein [Candidatus Aminicenantes bacterium]|nr:septal ring lytic transglycosylase RlpA family protein [Candidatus Aminicenantes bacterium]
MNTQRCFVFKKTLILMLCGVGLLTSCSRRTRYFPGGNVRIGIASWYGSDFHGKRTSNKEIYNMNDMTAAHKTLPFGTRCMVTNLNNGRSAVVRINDRGPFVGGRIIDLSYAAACLIDMVGTGIAPVRIDILKDQPQAALKSPVYSVQVGSFIYEDYARELESRLRKKFKDVYITEYKTPSQVYYRVRIKAKNLEISQKIAQRLCEDGFKVLILEEE